MASTAHARMVGLDPIVRRRWICALAIRARIVAFVSSLTHQGAIVRLDINAFASRDTLVASNYQNMNI